MNVVILKTLEEFKTLSRETLLQAHLVLCGTDGEFRVMKDRNEGRYDLNMSSEYLSEYIEKYA